MNFQLPEFGIQIEERTSKSGPRKTLYIPIKPASHYVQIRCSHRPSCSRTNRYSLEDKATYTAIYRDELLFLEEILHSNLHAQARLPYPQIMQKVSPGFQLRPIVLILPWRWYQPLQSTKHHR